MERLDKVTPLPHDSKARARVHPNRLRYLLPDAYATLSRQSKSLTSLTAPGNQMEDDEGCMTRIINPLSTKGVHVEELDRIPGGIRVQGANRHDRNMSHHLFLSKPLLGPLLFSNTSSDARDHCANERTFLSWLRLSIYMSVVSAAIVVSFHLKSQPTAIEKRAALPLGLVFWVLSLACLVSGLANYVKTVTKYSKRQALVQSGWKTQVVSVAVSTIAWRKQQNEFVG